MAKIASETPEKHEKYSCLEIFYPNLVPALDKANAYLFLIKKICKKLLLYAFAVIVVRASLMWINYPQNQP
jgi:hypothetical protein